MQIHAQHSQTVRSGTLRAPIRRLTHGDVWLTRFPNDLVLRAYTEELIFVVVRKELSPLAECLETDIDIKNF